MLDGDRSATTYEERDDRLPNAAVEAASVTAMALCDVGTTHNKHQ